MIKAGDFSERDWKLAPTYASPLDASMGVVLDFRELSELAREEEASGAFRRSEDGTLARAPLYVDNLPAAFYRVATSDVDFTPNHNTSEQETIVVMEGILRIVLNTGG